MRNPSGSELRGRMAIVGASAWADGIRRQALRAADCPSNVLITGPTGTGKEVIARAIHAESPRAGKPFIPVDCGAIPAALFSSHLFGHLKGAFTGAEYAALGCFRAADGGTIFLDEIGELEAEMQTKLLRVLQQRTVCPVGGHQEIPIDVRVLAATHRDLPREVRAGRFREDLYYRLNVVSLRTAPLRERPEDIAEIARHFLGKLSVNHGLPAKRLSEEAVLRLQQCDWPGNVRQLENVLERAAFSSQGPVIGVEEVFVGECDALTPATALEDPLLPRVFLAPGDETNRAAGYLQQRFVDRAAGRWSTMAEMEREHIRRTLTLTNGNQSKAAELLGIERHRLARKLRKYGLDWPATMRNLPCRRAA